jgi:thiamine-monophosphate kinase
VLFGDDVSAVSVGEGRVVVLKTDMLVDKTDVPRGMSLWQAARKAVVMNVSDCAAKGVEPKAALVSLGLPRNLLRKDVEEIARGLNTGARQYGAYVVGGDTGEASDLVIAVSLFGTDEKKALMLRSGAKPGDVVAVTGLFGKTSAGLKILLQNLSTPPKLKKRLMDSVLMPRARLREGLTLAQTGAVSASIDSSDGLAWSLHEISQASGVGFEINNLPIAEEAIEFAKMHKLNPVELALYGGEEYELVITVKPRLWKKLSEKVSLIKIGRVTKEKALVSKVGKKTFPIEARGWEHFKTSLAKS